MMMIYGRKTARGWTRAGAVAAAIACVCCLGVCGGGFLHTMLIASAMAQDSSAAAPKALTELGHSQLQAGQADAAIETFKRVTKIFLNRDEEAAAYRNLGLAYEARGDRAAATENYKKARKSYDIAAKVYEADGKFALAEAAYMNVIAITDTLGDENLMPFYQKQLADFYVGTGNFGAAEAVYKNSLALVEALAAKQKLSEEFVAIAHGDMGDLYKMKNDAPQACTHWRKARDLYLTPALRPSQYNLDKASGYERLMSGMNCPASWPRLKQSG